MDFETLKFSKLQHFTENDFETIFCVHSVSSTRDRRGHGNGQPATGSQDAFEIIREMETVRESCKKLEAENKGLLHDVVTVKQQNENLNAQNQGISAKYDAIQKEHVTLIEQVKLLKYLKILQSFFTFHHFASC